MSTQHEGWLQARRHRSTIARWKRIAADATGLGPAARRRLRTDAQALRTVLAEALHALDRSPSGPERALPALPDRTEAAWRLTALVDPLETPHAVVSASPARPAPGLALFHDATDGEVILRQTPAQTPGRHHLDVEVFHFDGSFLSLVIDMPAQLSGGLGTGHLLGVLLDVQRERPERMFLRLNLQHGPNITQLVTERPASSDAGNQPVEFDLAEVELDGRRIDRAWIDLIPEHPAMDRLSIRELVVARRPRAQF